MPRPHREDWRRSALPSPLGWRGAHSNRAEKRRGPTRVKRARQGSAGFQPASPAAGGRNAHSPPSSRDAHAGDGAIHRRRPQASTRSANSHPLGISLCETHTLPRPHGTRTPGTAPSAAAAPKPPRDPPIPTRWGFRYAKRSPRYAGGPVCRAPTGRTGGGRRSKSACLEGAWERRASGYCGSSLRVGITRGKPAPDRCSLKAASSSPASRSRISRVSTSSCS